MKESDKSIYQKSKSELGNDIVSPFKICHICKKPYDAEWDLAHCPKCDDRMFEED